MKTNSTNKSNRLKSKSPEPVILTRADLEAALNEIALTTIQRNSAQLAVDAAITAVREQYEATITACNESLAAKTEQVRLWAESNPNAFGKAKSLETIFATIGWRTDNPSVKTLPGWTFKRALARMKDLKRGWARFIRTKEEIDKEAILSHRNALKEHVLARVGLAIAQEESFFIEPNLTPLDNRAVAKEAA